MKTSEKVKAGVVGSAIAFLLVVQWLARFPEKIEKYYSDGLYPVLTFFISNLSGQFSFSLSEAFIWFVALIILPTFVGKIVRRKMKLRQAFLNLILAFSVFSVLFYCLWGLNYLRMPLAKKMNLDAVELKIDAFDSTSVQIIHELNRLNYSYSMRSVEEINEMVASSYGAALSKLGLKKVKGTKVPKTMMMNWILNKTTTGGWFSPFLHEMHYNEDLLITELPFVIAHEKAHQLGYASESEANFLAYVACISSTDALVQYSGYFSVLGYFLRAARRDSTKSAYLSQQIAEGVKLDMAAVRQRWQSHYGTFSQISEVSYDFYLKANKVKAGRLSYSHVVDLIIRYDLQEKIHKY